jgi:hypothetical protein
MSHERRRGPWLMTPPSRITATPPQLRWGGDKSLPGEAGEATIVHLIVAYLKFGESLAKIGIVTLSVIAQTMSW